MLKRGFNNVVFIFDADIVDLRRARWWANVEKKIKAGKQVTD